jgi:phosphate transport system substrate-binding protein
LTTIFTASATMPCKSPNSQFKESTLKLRRIQWMNGGRLTVLALMVVTALVVAGCGGNSGSGGGGGVTPAKSLQGAGATFPEPVYSKMFQTLNQAQGTQVNYQAIGSGGGITQFTNKTVDFGATDAPMTNAELAKAGGDSAVVHVPTVLGAIVLSYNLDGVSRPLKLDGQTIGNLFLGNIKTWNDAAIARLNPGVNLPSSNVTVVHRSDSSGTTANFTQFLADENAQFKSRVGAGKEVNWPTGIGGKGNDGVAATIGQNKGAIGYVELQFAVSNNLKFADVKNKAGEFVTPSVQSTSAAASDLSKVPADLRISLVDSPAKGAYPIATWTFIIAYSKQSDASKSKALVNMLWFMTHEGQSEAAPLNYAPLPQVAVTKVEAKIKSMTGPDGKALYTGGA